MTDQSTDEISIGPPPPHVVIPGRRFRAARIVVVLLVACGGIGVVLLSYDWFVSLLRVGAVAVPSTAGSDNLATFEKDLETFQQQTGSSIQTVTDALTAQQLETKRLADQMADLKSQVISLSSKIDLLRDANTSSLKTQAPAPIPPAAPRKKPAAPKPAGAISVGGAPLASQPVR